MSDISCDFYAFGPKFIRDFKIASTERRGCMPYPMPPAGGVGRKFLYINMMIS